MTVLAYKFGGKRYIIRDSESFAAAFVSVPAEKVHEVLSVKVYEELFSVVCSVFGIGASADLSGKYSMAKSTAQVAGELGKTEAEVSRVIVMAGEVVRRALSPALASSPVILGDDELLARFGFEGESDEKTRAYLLERIGDLRKFLESPSDRGDALRLLESELMLHFVLSPEMRALRRKMQESVKSDSKVAGTDNSLMEALQKRMESVEKTIDKRKELLGIGEGSSGGVALKDAVQSNVHTLIAAHAQFYANGERAFLDGIFTAAEVAVIGRPFGDRGGMWRPDALVLIEQYRAGLFDPKFEVQRMPRELFRALRRGISNGILQAMSEDDIPVTDLMDDGDADDDAAGAKAGDEMAAAPITAEDMKLAASDGSGKRARAY